MARYHDEEWGVAVADDNAHFERLTLEIFQAGLSWRMILHRRPAFRKAFARFSIARVARFGGREVRRLLNDAGIIRNRLKIEATIENACTFLRLKREHGSFVNFLNGLDHADQASVLALFKKTFRFMGPEIARSYLESVGKIRPRHEPTCWKATGPRRG